MGRYINYSIMVKLSKQAVTDFQKLVLKKQGIKLSYEEAELLAVDWLEFVKFFCTPIKKEAHGKNEKKIMD